MSVEEIDVVVSFLKVGHGDAAVIRFREGHEIRTIVVDGGGPRHATVLLAHLLGNSITHLDLVVATHIDRNHIAGLLPVVESERLTLGHFWGPACESTQPSVPGLRTADERAYQRLYSRVMQRVRPEHVACPTRGMPLPAIFRDCTVTVLNPLRQNVLRPSTPEEPKKKPMELAVEQNEQAIVLRIECHGLPVLLTSDVEGQALASLLSDPSLQDFLDADIVKIPHYGRASRIGPALVRAVRDRCAAVLSIAAPDARKVAPDILSAMHDLRAEVFCTAHPPEGTFCTNPHCRAAKGGQNIVFFYPRGESFVTPSADACVVSLRARP